MRNKKQLKFSLPLALLLIFVLTGVGCTKRAIIGSPYERYDHNRTRQIVVSMSESDTKTKEALVDEVYIPFGSGYFPKAHYQNGRDETDGLPAANVVPVFTGVPLPLSSEPAKSARSDKEDLIDYLAKGPFAHAGVQRGAMMGDIKAAEAAYRDVLEFLQSKDKLSQSKEKILENLSSLDASFADEDEIIDARYSLWGSFDHVLAFRYKEFWFLLYKLPDMPVYSRLVVAPEKGKVKDRSGKKL